MGKGGSSTSVEIPAYIEDAARNNLQRADFVSKLGYVPQSFGATTAAFTPMQQSAFGNTAQAADAFGLGTPTGADIYGGMGAPTQFANGVSAYSAAPIFNQTMADFAAARPGQFNAINSMFIDQFGYNPAGAFNMSDLVDINSTPIDDTTTSTTTSTGGGGGASDFPVGSSATATDFTVYSDDNNNNTATNQFGSTVSVGYGVGQVDPALAAAAGYTSSPAPGVLGNNATGENNIVQTIANLVTPFNDTAYQGGILKTNEAAAAAAKEAARIAAKKRRDKKASKDNVDNYKSGGQMFRGQGGR